MAEHNTLTGSSLHEPKGASSAVAGQVYVADGAGSGSFTTQTSVSPSNNTVYVNSEADLPAAVSGAITLADDTTYFFGADLTTSNRLIWGSNSVIKAPDQIVVTLTYSGTSTMITSVNTPLAIHEITLSCPTAQMFDSSSSDNSHFHRLRRVTIADTTKLGDITNMSVNHTEMTYAGHDDGWSLSGTNIPVFAILKAFMVDTNASSVSIDFGSATFNKITLDDIDFVGTGTGLSGLANGGNLTTDNKGTLHRVNMTNMATPLSGIATTDKRWRVTGSAGLNTSRTLGNTYYDNASAETVTVSVQGTFYEVGGTSFSDGELERFTATSAGILTYTAEEDIEVQVLGTISLTKSGGGADELEARIAVNGTPISKLGATTQHTEATTIPIVAFAAISEGDTISLQVANNDSTANILVSRAELVVEGGVV